MRRGLQLLTVLMVALTLAGCGPSIVTSPDGRRAAQITSDWSEVFVTVDGKEERNGYTKISAFMFSPLSDHYVYAAVKDKKHFVIVDGKVQGEYDFFGLLKNHTPYSQSSYKIAFGSGGLSGGDDDCRQGTLMSNWIGDALLRISVAHAKSEPKFTMRFAEFIFSPDGKRMAYWVEQGQKWFVVIDGEKSAKGYDSIGGFEFSPNSRHTVYWAQEGDKWLVVRDGKEGQRYNYIGYLTDVYLSSSRKKLPSFKASDYTTRLVKIFYAYKYPYLLIWGYPTFSPDSEHLAYIAGGPDKLCLIVDGEELEEFPGSVGAIRKLMDSNDRINVVFSDGGAKAKVEKMW